MSDKASLTEAATALRGYAPTSAAIEPAWKYMHNNPATNELARARGKVKGSGKEIDRTDRATITTGKITLFITNYSELISGFSLSAKRLLDAIVIKATQADNPGGWVSLPLGEYASWRETSDLKTLRDQSKEDLQALWEAAFTFEVAGGGEPIDTRLLQSKGRIEKGVVIVQLGNVFYSLLKSSPIMPVVQELFVINQRRNPYSYNLLRRAVELKNMNAAHENKGDIISVRTLIESCPDLPKIEDVKKIGGVWQRIVLPFQRDMTAIKSFKKWEYCGAKGAKVKRPETYDEFINAYVKIEWEKECQEWRERTLKGEQTRQKKGQERVEETTEKKRTKKRA